MAKRKKQFINDLLITGIADKGKAIGKTADGQVVFVENVVPGDVVDVLVLRKKKSYSEGIAMSVKKYSDDRIKPVCDHFGVCGGCKWQNISYEKQLEHKYVVVRDVMQRIGKVDPAIVRPILGCDQTFRYRNKLEYSFSNKRWITAEEAASDAEIQQSQALGFHRPGFHDKIVDIDACWLQDDKSNEIRNFVREFTLQHGYSYYDTRIHEGDMRNMVVRNTTLGQWMVIVVFGTSDKDKIEPLMAAMAQRFPEIQSLLYIVNKKVNDTLYDQEVILYKGNDYIEEKLGPVLYRIGPKSFFQTNTLQAIRLFDIALAFAACTPDDNLYDLYTGLGSIALYGANHVKQVVGIEEVVPAIEDALANMERNGIGNAVFYAGDVKNILNPAFAEKHGKPDVIITDPPRAGMHEDVVNTLLELEAPRLVYISCNPATQARDLVLLQEKYDIVTIQPVDMFPHTHHIECVAKLQLK
jgi:23S rRNA (uracil1939-C5)-methyltransferase